MSATTDWESIAALHRTKQLDSTPSTWLLKEAQLQELRNAGTPSEGRLIESKAVQRSGLLSDRELLITEDFKATELLAKISCQELSSEEVVVAFCKRASLAQQLTSCLTEVMFNEAIERAKILDKQLKETGKLAGPLHGLPISLKDTFVVKGHHATVGYVEFLRRPIPDTNSALVDLLVDAGAVLFCKTNLPQTMMTADSENNVFGRTLNPHNTNLTAGGSTGGEGALLSFRGSPLGVGTDIAGSIRIPSLCCGIYGFKPTGDRVPFWGQAHYPFPRIALPGVVPTAGPMGNSVEDLLMFMRTVMGQQPWRYDPTAINVPWRDLNEGFDKPLTIGILSDDPSSPVHPPVRRALEKAASALQKDGHNVVHLSPNPQTSAGLGGKIGFQYFGMGHRDLDAIAREIGEPLVASVVRGAHPFGKGEFPVSPDLPIPQRLSDLNQVKFSYAKAWQQTWLDNELDVILTPGAVSTAVPHDTYGIPNYTTMWNVLDYPAGIIPYGTSSKFEDDQFEKGQALFDPDYQPEVMHGAPCALQVVTPRFQDEECLRAMQIIDKSLRLHSD
ncbi:hypothetical protein FZEAL_641 [Fusarium zealandicum]|uniref:Amidase domain-containing protein n=1 Tax=Fusarium zealandicum TaxID=1053134 RepID=A0A8H4XQ40_9HYPO|nr:hypothetical protein FZEAL_641 [Fusarium zealandicum]